jgi:acetyltransferase-like isoleucine patch superfamily enzyme
VIRFLASLIATVLPWSMKRFVYRLLGHEIDATARVGLSLLVADHIRLGPGASIGHLNLILVDDLVLDRDTEIRQLNVIRHCDLVHLEEGATIGGLNLVNGTGRSSKYMTELDRTPALLMGAHATITYGHFLDTSDTIRLDAFSGLAGWGSQLLTHSVDVHTAKHVTAPIVIGEHSVVATAAVILQGGELPHHCLMGANSLLNKKLKTPYRLYGGTPATEQGELDPKMGIFLREVGEIP